MVGSVDREWLFRELRRSLRLLAEDGDAALALVPARSCKPDELALDFNNFRSAVVGNFAADLPPELVAGLAEMDAALAGIQGQGWSEEAVRTAPEWAAVRRAAAGALGRLDRFEEKLAPAAYQNRHAAR